MVDYRKFDNIGDSDSDAEESEVVKTSSALRPSTQSSSAATATASIPENPPAPTRMVPKGREGRYRFEYDDRLIYEWEQNLSEVLIYIPMPPQVRKADLKIVISPTHLMIGLKSVEAPPYIDEDTGGHVIVSESFWQIDEGDLIINLQKSHKAAAWDCALKGRQGSEMDAVSKEEVRKKLMLERFQEEHPSFDFSGAEFSGQVPDAREFMGGVKYG